MTQHTEPLARPEWIRVGAGAIGSHWLSPAAERPTGVLIVPSVGHEDQSMHRGLVLLARRLARSHHVVMLQHWATDQSDGIIDDPDLFDRWREGVVAAIDTMRWRGITDICVIGARLGALIAVDALPRPEVRRMVLWTPITSGRRFGRELRLMQAAGKTAVDSDAGINVGGYRYPMSMLADLATRQIRPDTLPAPQVMVIDHAARRCDSNLLDAWRSSGGHVDHVESDDIAAWADRSIDYTVIPFASLGLIERWLGRTATADEASGEANPTTPNVPPPPRTNAHGEQQLAIESSGLQVVLTQPERTDATARQRVATVLYSTLGPGRAFVELARREAVRGRSSLRVDARGWRWSPARQRPRTTYQTDGADHDEFREAMQLLDADGAAPKVLVGFCLGALSVLRLGDAHGAHGVIAINPPLFDLAIDPDQVRFERRESSSRLKRRAYYGWRFLASAGPVARRLRALARSGTRVLLLFDDDDIGFLFWRYMMAWRLPRLLRSGMVVVANNKDLGHNLEGADTEQVFASIGSFIDNVEESTVGRAHAGVASIHDTPAPLPV